MIEFKKAVRKAVPLLVGIVGPSGTGKTLSALRLAKGIQKITGGRIKVIDTENERALQYADFADFDHFSMKTPYSSLRYLEVILEACKIPGPTIVDSMSHEHEGIGGYIDLHDQEVKRLVESGGFGNEYKANVPAWGLPAKNRGKLINGIVTNCKSAIFCFRAKEKVDMDAKKPDGSKTIGNLGWMPIAGDAFVYEMVLKLLLRPGADGVPTLIPDYEGEKATTKIPMYLRDMFDVTKKAPQLSEAVGEKLAQWAAGGKEVKAEDRERHKELCDLYPLCSSTEGFKELEARRERLWSSLNGDMQVSLKFASTECSKRIASKPSAPNGHVAGVDDPSFDEVPR